MFRLAGLIAVVLAIASAAGACGGTVYGDCSGGTGDGQGNCIPNNHGPAIAQRAAFQHFGDRAEQVACLNHGPFRYQGARYHQYLCIAIRDGDLQPDDNYCVIVSSGAPISDAQTAAILAARPLQRQRCTT